MITDLMWIITIASIIGTIANIYQKSWCFWLWGSTNLVWAIYDCSLKAWPQAALMVVYFILSIWGIIQWRKNGIKL